MSSWNEKTGVEGWKKEELKSYCHRAGYSMDLWIKINDILKSNGFDNCLGVQLGNIKDCRSGVDFIHITPSGERKNCCFGKACFLHE